MNRITNYINFSIYNVSYRVSNLQHHVCFLSISNMVDFALNTTILTELTGKGESGAAEVLKAPGGSRLLGSSVGECSVLETF